MRATRRHIELRRAITSNSLPIHFLSTPQVLNEVNHSDRVRFPLMNPAKPTKVLERVATGADKIFVLVSLQTNLVRGA